VRLFVALAIPESVQSNLAALIQEMRAVDGKAKWVRPENLHVTLKFIGETAPEKLDAIRTELSEVRSPQPVHLQFQGIGFFPNARRPRVLWAGMEASPNLAQLAADVDKAIAPLGFPLEVRAFTPHLTLARFDPPGMSAALRAAAERNATRKFGILRGLEFQLIQSKLQPTGAEYTTLHSFPFAAEA
jgi:RNA 2',3'-cyclic 3'-phosphodiesterase